MTLQTVGVKLIVLGMKEQDVDMVFGSSVGARSSIYGKIVQLNNIFAGISPAGTI